MSSHDASCEISTPLPPDLSSSSSSETGDIECKPSIVELCHQKSIAHKQRSITKTSLILTSVTVGLFCVILVYVSYLEQQNPSYSFNVSGRSLEQQDGDDAIYYHTKNCEDIFDLTSPDDTADRCLFAQSCNQGEGFPFSTFVFCSTKYNPTQWLMIAGAPLLILLTLLFRLLGSTAEDYFSPSLEMFSKQFGLPPRFAGVTLLALGNGAADVSAIMSAVTSNPTTGYEMAMGSLTGGGMFIGTVVAGVVIVTAGSVTCRGALVRDVTAMALTVLVVDHQFRRGFIGRAAIVLFFGMYIFFVGIVLIADLYHRRVVLPRIQARLDYKERMRQLDEEEKAKESVGQAVDSHASEAFRRASSSSTMSKDVMDVILTSLSNYGGDDEEGSKSEGWGVAPDQDGMERMMTLHGKHGIITNNHHNHGIHSNVHNIENSPELSYHAMTDADAAQVEALEIGDGCCERSNNNMNMIFHKESWVTAFIENYHEFINHWAEYISNVFRNDDVHLIDKFLLAIEFPYTLARQMTVPVPTDGYYCRSIVAVSCILSPFWFAFYFWIQYDVNFFHARYLAYTIIFILLMLVLGLAIIRYAPPDDGPMKLVYSGPIAFYGFVIAATWIDFFADHLVNLLQFLGILFRIPSSILGITILAWGNSMGDLSANMAMAHKGLANMAMTACFAGPIFNILIGLAGGFRALQHSQQKDEIEVELSPSITIGFAFLLLNSVAIIGTGVFLCKGVIPKSYGYFALLLYSVYIFVSIGIQFAENASNDDE